MYRHDTFLAEWQLGWEGGRTGVVGLQGSQRGVPEMGMHHLGADIVAICCLGRPEDLHNGGTSVARHPTQQIIIPTAFKSQIIQIQINICISHQDITKYNIKNTKNSDVTGIQIKKFKILTKRIQISYNTNLYLPTPTTAPKRINIRKIPTNPKY